MSNSLVSICIPTYNGERYLKECIDSALTQSYTNFEIIIVDDASSDKTISIIEEYLKNESRIRLYKNEVNLGLVSNWNRCIELAQGEWIKFVFQDDYLVTDCVEKMLKDARQDNALIACKRTFLVDAAADDYTKNYYQNEVVTFEKLGIPSEVTFISPENISRFAAENICMNFIAEPTSIMFKKPVIEKLGTFSVHLSQICDLEFCLRIATNYGVTYIPEPLTRFRIHASSTTSSNLSAKGYTLSNIDPVIVVHQLLYNDYYSKFRNEISYANKLKLKNFFAVRVYEAYRKAQLSGLESEEMKKFNSIVELYPEISGYKEAGLNTKILYQLVKLRRTIKILFN